MSDIAIQASFNSGEWAPNLFARVDLQKWHSAAALLQNWFVDYRGGASTRPGSQYIIQAYKSTHDVRLIRFQAAFNIGYMLEFGDLYIRFIYQGSPVVQTPIAITGATKANPCVLTVVGNSYSPGDWIYVTGVAGMTQLNGRYFNVSAVSGSSVTLSDLDDSEGIDSTGYGTYTSGGTAARLYVLPSPYAAADLALLKFTQATGGVMILTHAKYQPYTLTLISATNWVLAPITFGSAALTPVPSAVYSSLPTIDAYSTPPRPGNAYYGYVVTAVDNNGQESTYAYPVYVGPRVDIRTYPGSNYVNFFGSVGARYYKIYEANISYFGIQPATVQFGYVGYTYTTVFIDDNITPDFSQTPPVYQDPFIGNGIAFITVTTSGTYTSVPAVSLVGGSPVTAGSANAVLSVTGVPTVTAGGTGYVVGDTISFGNSLTLVVTGVSGSTVTAWAISGAGGPGSGAGGGVITSGSTPSNPIAQVNTTGLGSGATATATWGVGQVLVSSQGAGYASAPTVTFSSGSAAATATLSPTANGNPSVPAFFQQRLVLAGPPAAPQTFYMSQPGGYYNFNVSQPVRSDDAITGTLVSNAANSIKSMISVPAGLLIFTDQSAWVVNGGAVFQGISAAVTPTSVVASEQNFVGANDMPPIKANFFILFVQSKGAQVRELQYNIYVNIFSSTDISVLSSHLFYGYTLLEWTYAEQPFYSIPIVRDDGVMLNLTYLKEQEFVGWSHYVTQGSYISVASTIEPTANAGIVDAIYTVVERVVDGVTLKYIERFADRVFPNGLSSAWCVDSGMQYSGPATLAFQGADHLDGLTVTGLATDDQGNVTIITPFVMPDQGLFTLPAPPAPAIGYTLVTVGLAYTCDLQTLPLDLNIEGSSIQGKPKKIPYVDVRVNQTLGLKIGSSFGSLVPMKDLVPGNVSSMLTGQPVQLVSGLYTGDTRTFLDPTYTIPGQYCIRQDNPYPATVLGVFPAFTVGDDR